MFNSTVTFNFGRDVVQTIKKSVYKGLYVFFLLAFMTNFSWAAEILSDPTRPAHYMAKPISSGDVEQVAGYEFKVSQILIGQKKRMAIVNGQKVNVGDNIKNAKVVAIKSDSVQLLFDGKLKEISITPSIKQYKK